MFWFEWDRCQRLRVGVANLFVERGLSHSVFGELVQDIQLFNAVAEQATRARQGRSYPKLVHSALEDTPEAASSVKSRALENLLR